MIYDIIDRLSGIDSITVNTYLYEETYESKVAFCKLAIKHLATLHKNKLIRDMLRYILLLDDVTYNEKFIDAYLDYIDSIFSYINNPKSILGNVELKFKLTDVLSAYNNGEGTQKCTKCVNIKYFVIAVMIIEQQMESFILQDDDAEYITPLFGYRNKEFRIWEIISNYNINMYDFKDIRLDMDPDHIPINILKKFTGTIELFKKPVFATKINKKKHDNDIIISIHA
jgi:hypothetical protein